MSDSKHEPNRLELDPVASTSLRDESAAPPEKRAQRRADDPDIAAQLDRLISEVGGQVGSYDARLVRELMVAGLKLIPDGRDTGELKLMTAAVKELRYAYRVFGQYPDPHKVTIFGSARTPPSHPDYTVTVEFSRLMAARGWMVITGAGGGIMHAGHLGPGREASFGVAIRLPFETTANDVILGDEKLIHFRYFFTRKLMFLSQAEAVALLPGGFGTMDEAYEALTLIQTGKTSMIPVVMLEGEGGDYWQQWEQWTRSGLLAKHFISPEDVNLYHIAKTPADAADHIERFYRIYHSSRYVKDALVIRLKRPLRPEDVQRLETEFAVLIKQGGMVQRGPLEGETDHLALPRLVFQHTRHKFGLVRKLIDRINECDPAA
ncbi:MAG: LOG family protein [Phycisphaeraceae bacterium]|nr:LOG family protein [Phycisphaeraceae bacterium]